MFIPKAFLIKPVSLLAISNFRHHHRIYLILIVFAGIDRQVFQMPLNLFDINNNQCVSLMSCTRHIAGRGVVSTCGFQVVRKHTGTSRYIHIVCLECFASGCLTHMAIK